MVTCRARLPLPAIGEAGTAVPITQSPCTSIPSRKSEKYGKKPVDNGDIGNNRRNLSNDSAAQVADPFPLPYFDQVPESPALQPEPAYLEGLNPPQREAVLITEGPVLVLAGAGTGKTAALTARLAHLIATRKAWPSQILAVTFTNKAAREMKARISAISGGAIEGMPWLGTFHSVAARMLRVHAELVGLHSNFTILDTDDQLRVLKQLISAANLDEKRWPARQLSGLIDRWKNRGWTPAQVDAGESEAFAAGRGAELYAAYQERLKTLNACDFGDLLLHMLRIFRAHSDVLDQYRERFRYLLVDEYQDTNQAQYEWLKLLAEPRRNLCCVGDDDQSIYSWRGAEVANILKFEHDFPGAKVIRLEQNYRSTSHILAAADGLIAHNAGRLGKTLWTDAARARRSASSASGTVPRKRAASAKRSKSHQLQGGSLDDVAILVRAQFQTREFEERFIAIGLAYQIIGGFRFYERAEIRDAIAYLRLIVQPADDLAFERIVNQPKRGLGDKAIATIHRHARAVSSRCCSPLQPCSTATSSLRKPAVRLAISSPTSPAGGRWRARCPPRAGADHARRKRLHRDAPGRSLGRKRRPAREPRRTDPRDGGI